LFCIILASQLAQNIRRTFDFGLLNVCRNKTFGECYPNVPEKRKRLLMFCECFMVTSGKHCFQCIAFFLNVRYYSRQLNTKLTSNKIKLYKWIFFKIFDEKFFSQIERLELYVPRSSQQKQMIRLTSVAHTLSHNII